MVARPGDQSITLKWKKVAESDVQGYLVYYGDYPGQYFGMGSSLGDSPIDAGNTETLQIGNLKNGKLYYFAVVAYDSSDPPHTSSFSREVNARPSRMYR